MNDGESQHRPHYRARSSVAATSRCRLGVTTTVSVALFVIVAVFWLRSYWAADFLSYKRILQPGVLQLDVESVRGSIRLGYLKTPAALPEDESAGLQFEATPARQVRVIGDAWGFGYHGKTDVGFAYREVSFPHPLAMLAFAWLPLRWVMSKRRLRHGLARGLCLTCGYDLRASRGRCPECGVDAGGAAAAG